MDDFDRATVRDQWGGYGHLTQQNKGYQAGQGSRQLPDGGVVQLSSGRSWRCHSSRSARAPAASVDQLHPGEYQECRYRHQLWAADRTGAVERPAF